MSELKITSGIGDPSSPLYGQLLSVEDEKRLDPQGREVVRGLPWSEVRTGLYLVVFVSSAIPRPDLKTLGGSWSPVPAKLCSGNKRNRVITVGTFLDRPKMGPPGHGAALELPSDLARDTLKKQYVIEWLVATTYEALIGAGINLDGDRDKLEELVLWVSMTAEDAIKGAGL